MRTSKHHLPTVVSLFLISDPDWRTRTSHFLSSVVTTTLVTLGNKPLMILIMTSDALVLQGEYHQEPFLWSGVAAQEEDHQEFLLTWLKQICGNLLLLPPLLLLLLCFTSWYFLRRDCSTATALDEDLQHFTNWELTVVRNCDEWAIFSSSVQSSHYSCKLHALLLRFQGLMTPPDKHLLHGGGPSPGRLSQLLTGSSRWLDGGFISILRSISIWKASDAVLQPFHNPAFSCGNITFCIYPAPFILFWQQQIFIHWFSCLPLAWVIMWFSLNNRTHQLLLLHFKI